MKGDCRGVLFKFQLTRPRGTRHDIEIMSDWQGVSTHASARDATISSHSLGDNQRRFNSRVREGRDHYRHQFPRRGYVSTHASARDATVAEGRWQDALAVSTHASARDATTDYQVQPRLTYVSTHASARDATFATATLKPLYRVSTHASARDATPRFSLVPLMSHVSTHASARDAT